MAYIYLFYACITKREASCYSALIIFQIILRTWYWENKRLFEDSREPVINMSNSAEMTTVGGRLANNSCGALSGKSMGESHWASRSCERGLKLWVGWFHLSKGLPARPHTRHVGALLLRHGERGGGQEVVGQHWNYWQSQFHLKWHQWWRVEFS